MSIFGPIFSAHLLQNATITLLNAWFDTYLQEVQIQAGENADRAAGLFYPVPRTFTTRNEFDKFPEDQLPLCVVVSPGLASEPTKEGDGRYRAWFSLGVGVVVSARTAEETEKVSKIYAAAVRAILLHRQDIGGIASGVEWADESYDDLVDTDQNRSLRASLSIFRVLIEDITEAGAGPADPTAPNPTTQPNSNWPAANTVQTTVKLVGHDDPIK